MTTPGQYDGRECKESQVRSIPALYLGGLKPNERFGEYLGVVAAVYYWKYDRVKILPAYIGGTAEYGGTWNDTDDISTENSLFSGSLFLGLDSTLGPILTGWAYTDEGDGLVFIKIGRFF